MCHLQSTLCSAWGDGQTDRPHAGRRGHSTVNQPMVQPSRDGQEEGWYKLILYWLSSWSRLSAPSSVAKWSTWDIWLPQKGLKPNDKLVEAVSEFPRPTDVSGVGWFFGLSSYYRRFIQDFAAITEQLCILTRKNIWTQTCKYTWMSSRIDSPLLPCCHIPPLVSRTKLRLTPALVS